MKASHLWLRAAVLTLPGLAALSSAPAAAQRGVVIDIPANSNALGDCGTGCKTLSLGTLGTRVSSVRIYANGSISFVGDNYANTFFIAQSDTSYTIMSGYTGGLGGIPRTDLISFFDPSRDLTKDSLANFQIQFTNAGPGQAGNNLEVAFAYLSPFQFTGNQVPAGAKIGFTSTGLGVTNSVAGNPLENIITNGNGLLLGREAGDSQFSFILGTRPDSLFRETIALLPGGVFQPRYGVAASVPEPSSWAMMLAGFGLIGGQLRKRRRTLAIS